jgi:serine protease Do
MRARLALVATIAALGCSCKLLSGGEAPSAAPEPAPAPSPAPSGGPIVAPMMPSSFAELVARVQGSVVNVFAAQVVSPRSQPFGQFFPHTPDRVQRSQGTGFIIDSDGYLLTNHHVVEQSAEIVVQLASGEEVRASVVGSDERTDVALLRIQPPAGLQVPPLGDSDALLVGEWVLAIGNPFGLSHTVTAGIVSAKGRTGRDVPLDPAGYYNFIQTDASINPGNSGGPLFNMRGEIVGINTAINAAAQGIGFAIPINMVKQILPQLRANGRVTRSWLGIGIQSLSPQNAQRLGIPDGDGALVAEVVAGGPAAAAGLRPGDVIRSFDGHAIDDSSELPWLASTAGVGHVARLVIIRDRTEQEVSLRLAEMPAAPRP